MTEAVQTEILPTIVIFCLKSGWNLGQTCETQYPKEQNQDVEQHWCPWTSCAQSLWDYLQVPLQEFGFSWLELRFAQVLGIVVITQL